MFKRIECEPKLEVFLFFQVNADLLIHPSCPKTGTVKEPLCMGKAKRTACHDNVSKVSGIIEPHHPKLIGAAERQDG